MRKRELGSASLHKVGVVNLSDKAKPATGGEATSDSNHQAPRGDRRGRERKEASRNLGYPCGMGFMRESERSGVVKKRGNSRGAKGPCFVQAE